MNYNKFRGTKSYVTKDNYQDWAIALCGVADLSTKASRSSYFSNVRVDARHGVLIDEL